MSGNTPGMLKQKLHGLDYRVTREDHYIMNYTEYTLLIIILSSQELLPLEKDVVAKIVLGFTRECQLMLGG